MDKTKFTIKLAGINIEVDASYSSSKNFCKNYLTNESAQLKVGINNADIKAEQKVSEEAYSESYLETMAICRKIAEAVIQKNVLLMHGSAVSVDGNCHIFTGPSGIGKSTHVALWKKLLGNSVTIINDDKPLLKVSESGAEVFGTPWSGEKNINTNTSASLKSICFLEQSDTNKISEMNKGNAISLLLPQIYKSEKADNVKKTLELTDMLMKNVNFYKLECTNDISAAELSYKTLNI